MKNFDMDQIYVKFLPFFIILAIMFSVFVTVFGDVLNISKDWYIPIIFAILYGITVWTSQNDKIVESIKQNENTLAEIKKESLHIESILSTVKEQNITKLPTYKKFYTEIEYEIKGASKELLLTHIKTTAPDSHKPGNIHFGLVEEWSKIDSERTVRRIGSFKDNMKDWCEQQFKMVEQLDNFSFRYVDWPNEFQFLNIAIIDRRCVFIAISIGESAAQTIGLKIENDEIAKDFVHYFDTIWYNAKTTI